MKIDKFQKSIDTCWSSFWILNEQVARENKSVSEMGRSPIKIDQVLKRSKSPMIMKLFFLKVKSLDEWITQQVEQTLFLYKLLIQNLDEILLCDCGKERAFVVTLF